MDGEKRNNYLHLFGIYGIIDAKKEAKMEKLSRIFNPPEGSFYLFGPRGTGKSTLLKELYKESIYVDLLNPVTYRTFVARPETLTELIEGNPEKKTVVLDEIQKVPQLLDVVHSCIENNKKLQFVMTGSSSRKLKRGGVDLLAGRAVVRHLAPFMAVEMGSYFNMEEALTLGLIPLVRASKNPQDTLKAYITVYLQEEVQEEGLIRNIGNFARFLEVMSFSHGAVLNVSDIARDCQVKRKTVEGYIQILEDILLGYRIPVFTRRAKRHLSQHPKFYFFDIGIFRSLRPAGPLDSHGEKKGGALEGLVAQHLNAWISYRNDGHKLYFWRTKSGQEVDFVVYGPGTFTAIEVKNSAYVHNKDTSSLRSFIEDYPESKGILLYRGKEKLKMGKVLCIPCEEFLLNLHPGNLSILNP